MARIKEMMKFVKANNNPRAAIENFAHTNPQMKQALNYIQQSGGNGKEAFYKLAKEKGVDPEEILNMLQ